jgi:hypothetical protein
VEVSGGVGPDPDAENVENAVAVEVAGIELPVGEDVFSNVLAGPISRPFIS